MGGNNNTFSPSRSQQDSSQEVSFTRISDIKTNLVDKVVTIKGHVVKANQSRLRAKSAWFVCNKCGERIQLEFYQGQYNVPQKCSSGGGCRSRSFNLIQTTATYEDFQELKIQETQDDYMGEGNLLSAGRTPKTIVAHLTGRKLVDTCRTGDVVCIVGVVEAMNSAIMAGKAGRNALETSTYTLYLTVKSLSIVGKKGSNNKVGGQNDKKSKKEPNNNENDSTADADDYGDNESFSRKQLENIRDLASADHRFFSKSVRRAFPFDMLVRSLCPSIIGHELVKASIILCLLGGAPSSGYNSLKMNPNSIRSNCHILIVGDPGMGKSQMLLAASQVSARSVYVGGNTASATGLTVTLKKESGAETGIEAGALVLSDKGVCCIDEFDKMGKENQNGLLEAMEQQQVSIAKSGLVACLPARCSIIAAGNPKGGKFNKDKTVAENLNIGKAILSRFDMIFILQDDGNSVQDEEIMESVTGIYTRETQEPKKKKQKKNHPSQEEMEDMKTRLRWVSDTQNTPLPAGLIKDYIAYAKQYCFPILTEEAADMLFSYFTEQRKNESKDSIPITTRQLEALMRLSQARAKASLESHVRKEHVQDVIQLMTASMKQVQSSNNSHDGKRGKGKGQQEDAFKNSLKERLGGGGSITRKELYEFAAEKNLTFQTNLKKFIEDHIMEDGFLLRNSDGTDSYRLNKHY